VYLRIEPALRINAKKGTHFAKSVASALLKSDSVIVRLSLKLDLYGNIACLHKLLQAVINLK
jgi:hypothetical protein